MRSVGFIVAIAAAACASTAFAADFNPAPVRGPATAVNWAGFYVGGHLGYMQAKGKLSDQTNAPGESYSDTMKGFIGGGQIGYNFQNGAWVYGVEADISGSDASGSSTMFDPVSASTGESKQRVRWTSLLTARVGYAFDRSLLYIKGGAAFGGARLELRDLTTGDSASANYNKAGWTVGAGLEYALSPAWSVRGEYDYIALGTKTLTLTDNTGITGTVDAKLDAHQFKVGLNYRFGGR